VLQLSYMDVFNNNNNNSKDNTIYKELYGCIGLNIQSQLGSDCKIKYCRC